MDNIDYSQASIALQFLLGVIIILVVKFSVPSYLKKKGENQATKEDIGQLTEIVKRVETKFGKDLEQFKSDLDFRKSINLSTKTEEKNALLQYHSIMNEWIFNLFNIDFHSIRKLSSSEIAKRRETIDMFHQVSLVLSKVRLVVNDEKVVEKSRIFLDASIQYKGKIETLFVKLEHRKSNIEIRMKIPTFPPAVITGRFFDNINLPPNDIEILNNEIDSLVKEYTSVNRIKFFKEVQAIDEKYVEIVKDYLKANSA